MENKSPAQQIINTILHQTYTIQEISRRIRLLKEYVNNQLYKQTSIDLNTLSSNGGDLNWLKSLPTDFFNQFNKADASEIFEQLDRFIAEQKPLLIYIPFEMPQDEIPKLGQWLRTTYGEDFLFDLKYDPSLLAGCSLVWNGLHRDYSVRKRIEDSQNEIIKEMNSFISGA